MKPIIKIKVLDTETITGQTIYTGTWSSPDYYMYDEVKKEIQKSIGDKKIHIELYDHMYMAQPKEDTSGGRFVAMEGTVKIDRKRIDNILNDIKKLVKSKSKK